MCIRDSRCDARRAGHDPHPWQARRVVTVGGYGAPGRDPYPWQARRVVTVGGYGAPGHDPYPWQARFLGGRRVGTVRQDAIRIPGRRVVG